MFVVFSVKAVVSDHFKMFVGNMNNKLFDEFGSRDFFCYQLIILMPVVMEGNKRAVVIINAGGGDNRSAEIPADVFNGVPDIERGGFGIDVETISAVLIDIRLSLFK